MSKNKPKRFYAPGIYHRLLVKMVTQKWLGRYMKDKDVLAVYDHDDGEIYVSKELKHEPRIHSFYHELAHHIIETLHEVDEETKCDVLGAYLMKLGADHDEIKKNLTDDEGEE